MKFPFPSGIANSSTRSFNLPSTHILLLSVLRSCGNPGRPGYAVVSGKSYWVGSIVRYFCNPGYTLIGRGVRRCMSSGSWSGNTPQCKCQRRILKTRNLKRIWRILASFLLQNWVPEHSSGFTSHVLKKRESDFFFLISQSKTKKSECRSDWCLWFSTNIYFVKLWQTLWKIICNWKKKEFIDQLVIIRLHIMATPPVRKVDCIKNLNLMFMISLKPCNEYWYTAFLHSWKRLLK